MKPKPFSDSNNATDKLLKDISVVDSAKIKPQTYVAGKQRYGESADFSVLMNCRQSKGYGPC
jgi:hypothetical protein